MVVAWSLRCRAAEPEPAEYVRICDVYGTGYFYIPGTETCLRIGGYIRYDAGVGDIGTLDGAKAWDRLDGDVQDTWYKNLRFALRIWTGQETELGTLSTFIETRFQYGDTAKSGIGGDSAGFGAYSKPVTLNFAWIQLGGLRIGKDETAYDTFIGYAGNVVQDTLIHYGGKDTNLISYTFDGGNGFTGIVSLEEGSGKYSRYKRAGDNWVTDDNTIDSYIPHVVAVAKYKGDWGSITGVMAYNSAFEEWAGKVRLDVKASSDLTMFIMGGYGTDKNIDRQQYKPWGGNWAVWTGGTYAFSKKTKLNAQVSFDDTESLAVAANVAYEIVPGFVITPELDFFRDGRYGKPGAWSKADKKDSFGGIVRFQRNF